MPSVLSNSDLELLYLQTVEGATGNYLVDCRSQVYGTDQFSYFSGLSGLIPMNLYSLADHKYAYYDDGSGGSLSDAQRRFWLLALGL